MSSASTPSRVMRPVRAWLAAGAEHLERVEDLVDALLPGGPNDLVRTTAFWLLLIPAAVVAAGGVLADSTATVIGAMVIAPLGTPIFGIGLAISIGAPFWPGLRRVLLALLATVLVGMAFGAFAIERVPLLENSQVAARVTPSLIDVVIAAATGFVGAVALARRDVAPALPGVAIAISLVPPLAVTGILLGAGEFVGAGGSALLFATNMLAIVLMSILVFRASGLPRRRVGTHRLAIALTGITLVLVGLLTAITMGIALAAREEHLVEDAARGWADAEPAWRYGDVELDGTDTVVVTFIGEGTPPEHAAREIVERIDAPKPVGAFTVEARFIDGQRSSYRP